MRAIEFLTENKITLDDLYKGNFPDRDETFWDYVRPNEFNIPLEVKTLPKHKLKIMLLSQYRIEHLDELLDMMDEDQIEVLEKYTNDPNLSDKIIVISNDRIIDGNHRALAAAMKGLPIKYLDLGDLEKVDEMALAKYQPMGDFEKPGPFRGADKRLVPHPKNELKTQKFFEQTPYDFRLFFSNIPGTGRYSEYGPMSPDVLKIIFGDQADKIIEGSEDAITVVFVGNKGDSKVMLTPWMMAHRFGHAIQAGARGKKGFSAWTEAENHFFNTVNGLLNDYYGKIGKPGGNLKFELTPEYKALFNAIGTQRSSRTGQITRPYEFLYELFAQYLGTGKIELNAFPTNLGYGRKVFGNPTRYLNIKPEYRDENERKHAAELLARDMELMFDDVLSSSVGQIYVM